MTEMKSILITGVPGSGKSSVCTELQRRGYEAYDIENIEGLFKMYKKDTGEEFIEYVNDAEHILNADWRCDLNELQKLIATQTKEIGFYCGFASNIKEILPLFSSVYLLNPSNEEVHKRLRTREGSGVMGGSEESRQAVLGWKEEWENEMLAKAITILDGTIAEVADQIEKKKNE
jgi:cytidylate kinase